MEVNSIGYGAGQKNFEGFSNVLKLIQGKNTERYIHDSVKILETNVDDVSGEVLGNMIEKIMNNGAKDVTVSSAITKQGRPTHLVTIICDSNSMNTLVELLISETGTLGVRVRTSERITIPRSIKNISIEMENKTFKKFFDVKLSLRQNKRVSVYFRTLVHELFHFAFHIILLVYGKRVTTKTEHDFIERVEDSIITNLHILKFDKRNKEKVRIDE